MARFIGPGWKSVSTGGFSLKVQNTAQIHNRHYAICSLNQSTNQGATASGTPHRKKYSGAHPLLSPTSHRGQRSELLLKPQQLVVPCVAALSSDGGVEGRFLQTNQTVFDYMKPYVSRDFLPVDLGAKYFELIHDLTGLPWGYTIILSTIIIRSLVFLSCRHMTDRTAARLHINAPKLQRQLAQHQVDTDIAEKRGQFSDKWELRTYKRQKAKEIYVEHYAKYKCHPAAMYLPVVMNTAIFYALSFGLRDLIGFPAFSGRDFCQGGNLDFSDGGLLWIPNLLLPDTTKGLSLIILVFGLGTIEMNGLTRREHTFWSKFFLWVFRVLTIYMTVLSGYVPSGLALYWGTTSTFTFWQSVFHMSPTYRRLFKLPKLKIHSDTPYRDIMRNARYRMNKTFKRNKD